MSSSISSVLRRSLLRLIALCSVAGLAHTQVASFTCTPASGPPPLLVAFTDTSTGVITSWAWDFGDGSTSNLQHPSHFYVVPVNYTVQLHIIGPGGNDTASKRINVSPCATPATVPIPYNGQGINVPVLTAIPVTVPGTFTATLSPLGHPAPGLAIVLVRQTALLAGPRITLGGGPLTELLVANPFYANLGPLAHAGGGGPSVVVTTPIPASPALCGVPWAAQAVVTGGFIDLSSAVMGVTGF